MTIQRSRRTAREILERLLGDTSQTEFVGGKPVHITEHDNKCIDTALQELNELFITNTEIKVQMIESCSHYFTEFEKWKITSIINNFVQAVLK